MVLPHLWLLTPSRLKTVFQADETGWRVDGQNHWLLAFTNKDVALYLIDESRSSKVVTNVLGEKHEGILGSIFIPLITKFKPGQSSAIWVISCMRLVKSRKRTSLLR
jgi:hypothetical protein